MTEPTGPPDLRASDAEREHVADIVRRAVGDGRLTLVEGDERLAAAYAAVYRGDLPPITADLEPAPVASSSPGPPPAGPVGGPDRPHATGSVAVMTGLQRRGEWIPGRTHRAAVVMGGAGLDFRRARLDGAGLTVEVFALMGGVGIDLRGAAIGPAGVTIRAVAIMGGVEVVVDEDAVVRENGVGIMGGFADDSGPPRPPGGPTVRVTGLAFCGGVSISRKPRRHRGIDDQHHDGGRRC